jgi:hypothetical protein
MSRLVGHDPPAGYMLHVVCWRFWRRWHEHILRVVTPVFISTMPARLSLAGLPYIHASVGCVCGSCPPKQAQVNFSWGHNTRHWVRYGLSIERKFIRVLAYLHHDCSPRPGQFAEITYVLQLQLCLVPDAHALLGGYTKPHNLQITPPPTSFLVFQL